MYIPANINLGSRPSPFCIYVRIIKMRTDLERAGAEAMQIALFCTYVAIFISYRLHKEVEDAEKEYSARQREVYIIIHLYFNIHVHTYMHSKCSYGFVMGH